MPLMQPSEGGPHGQALQSRPASAQRWRMMKEVRLNASRKRKSGIEVELGLMETMGMSATSFWALTMSA